MKLSMLISDLMQVMKQCGDLDIQVASDPEGNEISSIDRDYAIEKGKAITIYPREVLNG